MAGTKRNPQEKIIYQPTRGNAARARDERGEQPKTKGAGNTLTEILSAQFLVLGTANNLHQVAKAIIAKAGSTKAHRLTAAQVADLDEEIFSSGLAYQTKAEKAYALRRILRWLWEFHGTPKLDSQVRHYPGVRPRNIIATREEIDTLVAHANAALQLWLLLCSDLAIRSGTAVKLNLTNYDQRRGELRFTTKAKQE
ncbi:MAG: hypothetical protein ABR991_09360 [Terracidiphilus sp.]